MTEEVLGEWREIPNDQAGETAPGSLGGDGGRWVPEAATLRAMLERRGFDVLDDEGARQSGAALISGWRDRGSCATVVVLDAGGRLRVELTAVGGETTGTEQVAGVPLRSVVETRRTATWTGTLTATEQLDAILEALDRRTEMDHG